VNELAIKMELFCHECHLYFDNDFQLQKHYATEHPPITIHIDNPNQSNTHKYIPQINTPNTQTHSILPFTPSSFLTPIHNLAHEFTKTKIEEQKHHSV